MKDTREFMDTVRNKVPPKAKVMVVWMEENSSIIHAAQANVSIADIGNMVSALKASTLPQTIWT